MSVSVVHKQDVIVQKVHTKCAELVDENNDRLFCCVSVNNFESKILIKGVHLTNFEKNRKLIFFLMKKGIPIVNITE